MDKEDRLHIARECFEALDRVVESLESHKDVDIQLGIPKYINIEGFPISREICMKKPMKNYASNVIFAEKDPTPEDDDYFTDKDTWVNTKEDKVFYKIGDRIIGGQSNPKSEWIHLSLFNTVKPKDEQDCLVIWKDTEGDYSSAIVAYWDKEEGCFFDKRSLHAFPVQVDMWCPIPEVPNE